MTNIPYSQMVAKLAKPGADIITQMTAAQAHLLHMAVGMAGESAEIETDLNKWLQHENCYHKEQAIKELGDFEFYLEGFTQGCADTLLYGGTMYVSDMHIIDAQHLLSLQSRLLLDMIKKHAIYGKDLDGVELDECLQIVQAAVDCIAGALGVTRDEVRARNMEKLAKRYPGFEFSTDAAIAQADKNV